MANKKTKGKKDENIKGLVVIAVILIALIIIVSLNGNHKDYSKKAENVTNTASGSNELYIGEIEIGNTTVIKAKIFLYNSESVPTISNGNKISLLTKGQLDFEGKVSIVGDQVKEIKPGGAVSGVLVELDSLVNITIGEEISIMNGETQVGTLIVEEIL